MTYKVGTKGQVVIDREIRKELGIRPGWVAVQRRVGERVEMRFYPAEHERSLRGMLAQDVTREVDDADWAEVREETWRRAVGEPE